MERSSDTGQRLGNPVILAGILVLLFGLATLSWWDAYQPEDASVPTPVSLTTDISEPGAATEQALTAVAEPPLSPQQESLAKYAEIIDRPLFSPSRRPLPAPTQRGVAQSQPSDFTLIGVISDRNGMRALVRGADANTRIVTQGGNLDGWTVESIMANEVRLSLQYQTQEIHFFRGTAAADN